MKMFQAFMVLPAFLLFYLIAAHANWKKKIVSAVLSLIVLTGISLSWRLRSTIHQPTAARMSESANGLCA